MSERPRANNEPPRRLGDVDDVVLVAAAQSGERDALDALLRRHVDRIGSVCRRVTAHDADGADATQNALIAIAKGIARFDGTSSFSTWSYRVATNAALDEVRRRGRRPMPTAFADDPLAADDRAATSGSSRPPVVDDLAPRIADRVDIDRAMSRLPAEFRAAVTLRDLCGLDYAEISEILAVPPGTVRSRIARGRAALLSSLGPDAAHVDATGNRTVSVERQRERNG